MLLLVFTIVFALLSIAALLLSHFQPIFVSFVTISAVLSRCFKVTSLFGFLP